MGVVVALSTNGTLAAVCDSMGNTALMAASRGGHVAICRALAGKGGDVNASNKDGSSALTLAVRGAFPELVSFLVGQGASITATTIGSGCSTARGTAHDGGARLLLRASIGF